MKKSTILIALTAIVAVVAVGYFTFQKASVTKAPVACTMEAKICPDGSSVGRTPPNCEFAPCPEAVSNWKTYANTDYGFEMKYPVDFFDQNQQPKLLTGDCNYNVFPSKCPDIKDIVANDMVAQGGDLNAIKSNLADKNYWDNPAGTKQTINGLNYCMHTTGDAATGHAFNYYYFTTVKNNKCLVVYMATSTTNCDFYLPLEKGNTEQEKNYNNCLVTNQNQPIVLSQIISTFKFTK